MRNSLKARMAWVAACLTVTNDVAKDKVIVAANDL